MLVMITTDTDIDRTVDANADLGMEVTVSVCHSEFITII